MKIYSILCVIILLKFCMADDGLIGIPIEFEETDEEVNLAARETDGNEAGNDDADPAMFFRMVNQLQDQEVESGEKVAFKCKVEGYPVENVTFTWYKGRSVLTKGDRRMTIKTRGTTSKLTFSQVFTSDSDTYICEASNGIQRVSTQAKLDVRFNVPPAAGDNEKIPILPPNKCEPYTGRTCGKYLAGRQVFVDGFSNQLEMEERVSIVANILNNPGSVTGSCREFALPALCYYIFPVCEDGNVDRKAEDRSKHLCREDCEVLKYDVCNNDFSNPSDDAMKAIAETANCSHLPRASALTNCLVVEGLPRAVDPSHRCYNDSGAEYHGMVHTTSVGNTCKTWPLSMVAKHKELAGGHNFCRNPENLEEMPWCFVDDGRRVRQTCNLPKCASQDNGSSLLTILIPSVAIPLVIALIALAFCICRLKKKPRQASIKTVDEHNKTNNQKMYELTPFLPTKYIVPELPANVIIYKEDLGEGQYGKVYKGHILQNPHFMCNTPVAVKTFNIADSSRLAEFHREIEVFSALQHQNVACLQAFVNKPNLHCLVFEYMNGMDLHEMLIMNSPNSDISVKMGASTSSQMSTPLEHGDFINMAVQISSGMNFLSTNNFVHRDLAARNVLVYPNQMMKICNLGVVRDCYLASYYRSPQRGEMLPLRWMSPEAINFNQFSERSAVWSFGVLLWEMFSFGLQPYCGFSNQEVLEMITNQRILGCPDQCSARVYSLMRECWAPNPAARPSFKDILGKLSTWNGANSSITSQLARGIHRQINSQMQDGYQGHYPMSETATSLSGGSVESPPRYNNMFAQQSNNSGSDSYTQHSYQNSGMLNQSNVGYRQQQPVELIVDMPPTSAGYQPNYFHRPPMQSTNSSENEIKTPGYNTQSQFNQPRIPRHSSISSRSTASGGSAREQRQHDLIQNKMRQPNNMYSGNPAFITRQNTGDEFVNMNHQQTDNPTNTSYSNNIPPIPAKNKGKTQLEIDAASSSSSDHTISCDSGLPTEDNFASSVRSPLLAPKPYVNPTSPNKSLT